MTFAPIAIVGQACLLPGASSCAELTRAVLEGRDLLSHAPPGRWRVTPELVLCSPESPRRDAAWSDRGGYVEGFEQLFDPTGFLIHADELTGLDPIFLWTLHTVREALRDAGYEPGLKGSRGALVMGNLSFPTDGLSRFAEATWLRRCGLPSSGAIHPRNRFSSGLPAHLTARALGLYVRAFALDAACASSLYAIKLACDLLHDGEADVAVAGAVNKTDDLFIHVGFCALQALSRTGRSRPFHREADGLVPAEGAAFVVLRRLGDALASGQRILGVIRGIGLSNDGRGAGGMLAPSSEGQRRAMELAYRESGVPPSAIGLLECHATGTPVGDVTELRSMSQVYVGLRDVPIGSLKSNLGHLITVAGVAGLQKVLGAMAAGVRPPTLHAENPLDELASSPFRLITRPEPWDGPRYAAISAFGFGGNNAHLIVEAPPPPVRPATPTASLSLPQVTAPDPQPPTPPPPVDLAVVACAVIASGAPNTATFRDALLTPPPSSSPAPLEVLTLSLTGLRFPPRDLRQALPQQLAMLQAAREALAAAGPLPLERTSILVGMGCDPEIARYGGRWRVQEWARTWGADQAWLTRAQDAFAPPLEAAGVLGTMPNIPANRINSQVGCGGPSFTLASEELSGLEALRIAARALRHHEIDAALVGASDFSAELIHEEALRALLPHAPPAGDAAVALVLRRLEDARRDGNPILAILSALPAEEVHPQPDLHLRFGKAHAATGLLHLAAAVISLTHGSKPGPMPRPWLPSPRRRAIQVDIAAFSGPRDRVEVQAPSKTHPLLRTAPPSLDLYAATDRTELRQRLSARTAGGEGPCRLAILSSNQEERSARHRQAAELLSSNVALPLTLAPGLTFRDTPLHGELAFVFGGPASIYPRMGQTLVEAFPELTARLSSRFRRIEEVAGWIYEDTDFSRRRPVEKLWAASFLMQLHAELTQGILGLVPAAYLGISSGETNALFASGIWNDLDAMFEDIERSSLYDRELAGEFNAARIAWGLPEGTPIRWENYRLLAPLSQVEKALHGEPRVHITIIHSPYDVVIGGDADACRRVMERIGPERARALGYDLVVHCRELEPFREGWWRLHHRPTRSPGRARIYSHAHGGPYTPTSDSVADALLGQALRTVDFPALVRRAYRDGVRIFLEHGPHNACSRWINAILEHSSDHVALSLDLQGEDPLFQVVQTTATLWTLGLAVEPRCLLQPLQDVWSPASPSIGSSSVTFPAHCPPPDLPPLPGAMIQTSPLPLTPQFMAPAPPLPSPLDAPMQRLPQEPKLPHQVQTNALSPSFPASAQIISSEVSSGILAIQQDLIRLHQTFLEQQTNL
ncbi:MAG: beta-ketoacyl synthase N-terminal-like domain-containing protein, partial [Myxococcales bacterium]|nr:hypothetical protein [Polyangiaceae bacterium]MDW8248699.1 beta-ketoacyl synthase N-terminal-like domain-containing protein [Myxococcales bacterium]